MSQVYEFKQFQSTIEKIIQKEYKHSLKEFFQKENSSIRIEKRNMLRFSIEKAGNHLFAGFYREVNGDLVSDPIFAFCIVDDVWHPVRIEQVLGDTILGYFNEDNQYLYYPSAMKDAKSFATSCAKEWKFYFLD